MLGAWLAAIACWTMALIGFNFVTPARVSNIGWLVTILGLSSVFCSTLVFAIVRHFEIRVPLLGTGMLALFALIVGGALLPTIAIYEIDARSQRSSRVADYLVDWTNVKYQGGYDGHYLRGLEGGQTVHRFAPVDQRQSGIDLVRFHETEGVFGIRHLELVEVDPRDIR